MIYQASQYGDAGGPAQGAFQGTGMQRTYSTGLNWDRMVTPTLITADPLRRRLLQQHRQPDRLRQGRFRPTSAFPASIINDFTSGMVTHQSRRLHDPDGRLFRQPALGPRRNQYRLRQHLDQDRAQPHHQVGRGHPAPPRRPAPGPDVQPARPLHVRDQPDFGSRARRAEPASPTTWRASCSACPTTSPAT